jgi:hypothetical protein
MTVYKRPGVYVNELALSSVPGASVGSANAAGAIVAAFPQGPSQITKVSSWYEFKKLFGDYNSAYPSTYSVGQFFNNGGTDLYVRRILHTTDADAAKNAKAAEVVVPNTAVSPATAFKFVAKSVGSDGNSLRVVLKTSAVTTGAFDLEVYREVNQVQTLLEQFSGLYFNTQADNEDITLSSDYAPTVLQYNSNFIKITNLTPAATVVATDTPTAGTYALAGAVGFKPLNKLDYLGATVDPQNNTSPNLGWIESDSIRDEWLVINQPLVFFFPDLVVRVGANSAWDTNVKTVYNKYIDFAKTNRHFVVVETNAIGANAVTTVLGAADDLTASSNAAVYFPNLYIKDPYGNSGSSIRLTGPSGAVTGLMLATDKRVGPFQTPAGLEAKIVDAVALEHSFTNDELDLLNQGNLLSGAYYPVNAIRNLPGAGIVVMGGRTLKQDNTANRYVAMRRSLIYIEKKLNDLAQFAIFETNDETLWARLTTVLGNFLNDYRNQGGLRGENADAAFFIKCDAENNTPATIAAGQVYVEVGVALEYPAEFIIINLSQKTAV